jgi:Zn-dependent metalloprotease
MIKKKWGFNSKVFSTITLVFVVCCFMATSSWAAKKVEFYQVNAKDYIKLLNKNKDKGGSAIAKTLGLTRDEEFKLLRKITDFNGVTHYRYQQSFNGVPVWGMHTNVGIGPADNVVRLNGTMVLDTPRDIGGIPASLDPLGALKQMEEQHRKKDKLAQWHFKNEKYGTYIYIDKKGKAHLCYVVSFFADSESGNPSQFIHFIDVKKGKVIDSFDMLRYQGVGPGGNLKVGYYYYGTDYPPFCVAVNGSTCTMNCTDVKTVDLNHGTSGTTAYSYACYENTHEEINGAYCPLNDAQYFGQVVFDTYVDWYGVPVLPFQLTLRCHYGTNYENAFWDGSTMTFGDGYSTFYPLVSLDVVAHEVSHGFTDYNSDLIYSGQSGGINEAFSDMAGEACEYYMRGSCDYMCGYDIFKAAGQALRYLYDPPLDGISIDHIDDYYEGMDVHYSSGIFNKAFYLIATSSGWTTRMAFDIFVRANQVYWQPSTNFQQGAEGAMNAAVDYGYSCQAVVNAFAVVGINLVCPGPPVADFTAFPTSGGVPLAVSFTDLSQAASSWLWDFGDGGTSTEQNPIHIYTAMGTYTVTLTATNQFGSDTEVKTNYITGMAPQPPIADFTASATDINIGNSVTFTDTSLENPTSWSWTFEGGTPSTSTAQNPTVTYNTVGTFNVTLTVCNAQGCDTETKVDYITVSVKPYCPSQGNTYSMEWIAGVQVGTMNNPSGAAGYTDFTSITCNLEAGTTVNVTLTPGFSGSTYTEYWKIWIDYNDDHDFEDAGEEVFGGSGSSAVSGSFTVAPGVDVVSRMRVSMKYGGYPTPCETFTYGEVEDYTVSIDTGFNAEDLVVRSSDARLWLRPFDNGIFGAPKQVGHGWYFTHYFVGHWNNDYPTLDLVVRDSNGNMRLYPYRNETFYTYGSITVGQNFNYTHYFVGNWTDNGTDDLIVRDSSGYLWLFPYVEDVGFGTGINLGGGWNYTHYFVGNWSGNGTPDLVCRDSSGYMWYYRFENGTFASRKRVGNGWNFTHYFVGNWTGDGTDDLIVRDSNGNMRLYPFRNESFYSIPGSGKIVAAGWNFTDYFVGNWENNDTDDMIVRLSNGDLKLYPFDNEIFGTGTTAGTGFNYTHYLVGQWTNDD